MDIEIFQAVAGKAYIYKLVDPRDGNIRYIGMTVDPAGRLNVHCSGPSYMTTRRKHEWVSALKQDGMRPRMFVIDECEIAERYEREMFWIKHHFREGHDLVNERPIEVRPKPEPVHYEPVKYEFPYWAPEQSMTIQEAAKHLSVSTSLIMHRVKAGLLTPLPRNPLLKRHAYRFNLADVEALCNIDWAAYRENQKAERLKSGPSVPPNPGTPRQDAND